MPGRSDGSCRGSARTRRPRPVRLAGVSEEHLQPIVEGAAGLRRRPEANRRRAWRIGREGRRARSQRERNLALAAQSEGSTLQLDEALVLDMAEVILQARNVVMQGCIGGSELGCVVP